MYVAAAVPLGQTALLLDPSTLAWARGGSRASPSQTPPSTPATSPLPCSGASSSSVPASSSTPPPIALPAAAQLPGCPGHAEDDVLCDVLAPGCRPDSGPHGLQLAACPSLRNQSPWGSADDRVGATVHGEPIHGACVVGGGCDSGGKDRYRCSDYRTVPAEDDGRRNGSENDSNPCNNNTMRCCNGDVGDTGSNTARCQAHVYASISKAAAGPVAADAAVAVVAFPSSGWRWPSAAAATAIVPTAAAAAAAGAFSGRSSLAASTGGAAATTTATSTAVLGGHAPDQAAVPRCQPFPPPPTSLPYSRSSGSGRASGGGSGGEAIAAAAMAGAPRRLTYGVKASAITSQISAAQRIRAATLIQAAWRGFRIRRLYLRLIVWRLRPPPARQLQQQQQRQQQGGKDASYRGIRELPPIPDLRDISLFTQYGRPGGFRSVKRRVWFAMEGPFYPLIPDPNPDPDPATTNPAAPPPPAPTPAPASTPAAATAAFTTASAVAALAPPSSEKPQQPPHQYNPQQQSSQPQACLPAPAASRRAPLRLRVPPRAEADVPMSEVERILEGGFWRGEEPAARGGGGGRGGGAGGGGGGRGGGNGGGGSGGEGEEGLSLYMRARMRREEREAEEALQMLSYEPHDLRHVLGSLRERTLERLGSLGRTLGETLSSGLGMIHPRGGPPHSPPHGQHCTSRSLHGQWNGQHWHLPGASRCEGQDPAPRAQARSLPRAGRWAAGCRPGFLCSGAAAAAGGSSRAAAASRSSGLAFSLGLGFAGFGFGHASSDGGESGGGWNVRMPLLGGVGAAGQAHRAGEAGEEEEEEEAAAEEEGPPGGGVAALPITVNWQRYRSRSHVTRMAL